MRTSELRSAFDTQGHHRTVCWAASSGKARTDGRSAICRRMLCYVIVWRVANRSSKLATSDLFSLLEKSQLTADLREATKVRLLGCERSSGFFKLPQWCPADLATSEVAVAWIGNIDPARCTGGYELDDDGLCHYFAFVPEDMDVTAARIDKRHVLGIDVGLAVRIVAEVVGHRSFGDDDQAVPRVRVPTGTSTPAARPCAGRIDLKALRFSERDSHIFACRSSSIESWTADLLEPSISPKVPLTSVVAVKRSAGVAQTLSA